MLEIQPTKDVPVPFDLSDEQPKTHADSIAVAVNTVEMIESLGGSLDFDAKDFAKAVELAKAFASLAMIIIYVSVVQTGNIAHCSRIVGVEVDA